MTDPLNNLVNYGEKAMNEAKNVRSIEDITDLGKVSIINLQRKNKTNSAHALKESVLFKQAIVNDGIKEAKSIVSKIDPVVEERNRQQMLMRDCISETLSDLNPTQLQHFIHVSNNLTAIIQMAFDSGKKIPLK